MISIEYTFNEPDRLFTMQEQRSMGASELDIWYFGGCLFLINNEITINLNKHGIVLLHALYNFSAVINNLKSNNRTKDTYRFNYESDDELIFNKIGDYVIITTSFDEETLTIPFIEFQTGIQKFGETLLSELLEKYPGLIENKHLQEDFSKFIPTA